MYGIRKAISGGAVVSVAVLGLLVVASAPAAAGPSAEARPFLTGALARGQPSHALEVARQLSFPRAPGSSKLDTSLAQVAGVGVSLGSNIATDCCKPSLAIRAAGLVTTDDGKVRVVIESRSPARASASVAALGGRVERTSGTLVQAVVPPSNLFELSKRSTVDLVRAPFMRVEHAVSGEAVTATLATAWHEKGLTGRGVKLAVIDGGFNGLAERQAEGESAGERRVAGLLRRSFRDGDRSWHRRCGDCPRDGSRCAALPCLRRHRGRSGSSRGVRQEPGRPCDQPLRGLAGALSKRRERSDRGDRRGRSSEWDPLGQLGRKRSPDALVGHL